MSFMRYERPHQCRVNTCFLFAHGAGANMDSDFMEAIAQGLLREGVAVCRIEFDYMAQRRNGASKRPPPSMDVVVAELRDAYNAIRMHSPCVVGGKSMGGRVATLLAAKMPVNGVICLGYPFHPPKKPDKLRVAHFPDLATKNTPALFVQGERDPFGSRDDVVQYRLPEIFGNNLSFQWVDDGDHDFKPRKRSGVTLEDNINVTIAAIVSYLVKLEVNIHA